MKPVSILTMQRLTGVIAFLLSGFGTQAQSLPWSVIASSGDQFRFLPTIVMETGSLLGQTQTAKVDSIKAAGAKVKEKKSHPTKGVMPSIPIIFFSNNKGGTGSTFGDDFKKWVVAYPKEYAEYKKIFAFKD